MKRKRVKKLLMSMGFTRDSAESAFVNRDMAGDPAELKKSNEEILHAGAKLIATVQTFPVAELFYDSLNPGGTVKINCGGKNRTIILKK